MFGRREVSEVIFWYWVVTANLHQDRYYLRTILSCNTIQNFADPGRFFVSTNYPLSTNNWWMMRYNHHVFPVLTSLLCLETENFFLGPLRRYGYVNLCKSLPAPNLMASAHPLHSSSQAQELDTKSTQTGHLQQVWFSTHGLLAFARFSLPGNHHRVRIWDVGEPSRITGSLDYHVVSWRFINKQFLV